MKRKTAFTLVELLVVIAILAILATVSIVGYTSFIKKGKLSNDETLITQWNTLLNGQEILEDKKYTTASQARALFLANGSTIDDFTPTTEGYHFHWNKEDNRIYLVDDTTNKSTYPEVKDFSNDFTSFNTNYLTFTATGASSVTPKFKSGSNLQYRKNGGEWTDRAIDSNEAISLNDGDVLQLRGANCITSSAYKFSMTGSIAASGSVTSLTDGAGLNPNVTLSDSCYAGMFSGCTSLTTAPELPATTLDRTCYKHMFSGCTSLTTAPELPATTLAINCYYMMFKDCTSLTTAPELPASALSDYCYYFMFFKCTSLTTAPELPATTLANDCYHNMFLGCTSLTTAPELPATTLADFCYSSMFDGCTSLTTAPTLPATTLAKKCYNCMFHNCTSLKVSTTSGNKIFTCPSNIPTDAVNNMFQGCIKGDNVNDTPAAGNTYYWN